MEKIFDIIGFDGGEGDDIYRVPQNGFYAGENIEVRKDLSGFQLSALLEDTGWTFDGDITCIVALDTLGVSGGGVVVCTDVGKIYLNGTLKHTLTSTYEKILNIAVNTKSDGTQYVYYITRTYSGTGKIHRSTTNLLTFTEDHREYITASGASGYIGVINNSGLVYIGVQNKVFILDNEEILLEYLVLPDKENIKFMSQFQGDFRIYTNNINTGIQYIWDGASTNPKYRQEWANQPILGGVNDGAFDYLVLGFNENYADLYLVSGIQKQEIRTNLETSTYARVLNGYLSIREGIIYISGGKSGESSNYGVYTYGNYYPGTRKSLILSYAKSTDAFLGHCHSEALSYFACTDGKVYKASHNNPPDDYAASGYVESLMYQGNVWSEMNYEVMRIGYKLNGGTIVVKVRTSFGDTWKTIKTITDGQAKRISKDEVIAALSGSPLGNFYEIQLRIELTPGSGSPIVKRVTTLLNTTTTI